MSSTAEENSPLNEKRGPGKLERSWKIRVGRTFSIKEK